MCGCVKRFLGLVFPALCLVASTSQVTAQQRADASFVFDIDRPSFSNGVGPVVCIDEAHNNFHTVDGRYKPFAELVRSDGFRVIGSAGKFTAETLAPCRVLVIANAIGEDNSQDWAYPHPSAFSKEELVQLVHWIRGGGALLLFADHAPMPGSAADLGLLIGLHMFDGYVSVNPGSPLPDVFRLANGTLKEHAITQGRPGDPTVEAVATFTGQAFQLSPEWSPLLVLPQEAAGVVRLNHTIPEIPRPEWPRFSLSGWSQGAARSWEKGRIVALGEAAMCSAQTGASGSQMGMNHPNAAQNPLFCLNLVRWLTRVVP